MLCLRFSFVLLLTHVLNAFDVARPPRRHYSLMFSTESTQEIVPIIVNGQNIELTPALDEYVKKRIGGILRKLASSGNVRECDVVLSVNRNPKVKNGHRVEVVTNVKGTTIICKDESPDMYSSIDAVASSLNRKLRTYKERRTQGYHGGQNMGEDLANALEALEEVDETTNLKLEVDDDFGFDDPERRDIMKVKSFQLDKPITLEEAVFALDYVDHDFYVFTNESTGQINVVYKRHTGGIGHVEP